MCLEPSFFPVPFFLLFLYVHGVPNKAMQCALQVSFCQAAAAAARSSVINIYGPAESVGQSLLVSPFSFYFLNGFIVSSGGGGIAPAIWLLITDDENPLVLVVVNPGGGGGLLLLLLLLILFPSLCLLIVYRVRPQSSSHLQQQQVIN